MMRATQLGLDPGDDLPASVGASKSDLEDLYRLLAIAKYDDRYVIPPAHTEDAGWLMAQHEQLFCSLDTDGGPGMRGTGPPRGGRPAGSVESFHPAGPAPAAGQPGDTNLFRGDDGRLHFNLLGWDGHGSSPHLFPGGGRS
jgi:nitrate reductase beta subunit